MLCLKPQDEHDFTLHIASDHPSGTFWYHPHNHGAVAYQLSNGVAGTLIVEGTKNDGIHDLDDIPEIAAARERIFVFQLYNFRARRDPNGQDPGGVVGPNAVGWVDATTIYNVEVDKSRSADIKVPPEDEDPGDSNTVTFQATAINGQINPTITLAPGEIQRWRLIHAGWDLDRKLVIVDRNDDQTDDFALHEIALDGMATGRMEKKVFVEIAPGQRSDVLITAPTLPPGVQEAVYHLKQTAVDSLTAPHGTAQDPLFLAKIVVTGRHLPMRLPDPEEVAKCRPLPDIRKAELSGEKSFTFQARDGAFKAVPKIPPYYTIKNLTFHDQVPIPLLLNTAEEWTITAEKLSHPFHIHVNPFQVVRYTDPDSNTKPMDVWRDTLYIKEGETYVIRTRFLDFPGLSVFHCHILDHEDQGMMVPLRFYNPGENPPAQEICKDMQPPATNLHAAATPAPPLRLPDQQGVIRDLTEYRGRSVALVFFQGVQCVHCCERLGDLVREARGRIGPDAVIVAVSSRRISDPAEAIQQLGITGSDNFSLLVDESHRAFRDFGCYSEAPLHGLFLIDLAGVIRARHVGESPFGDNKEVVERLVGLSGLDRDASR
jgi:FtsP/CotA-like multicopper oxidase with cupredoxin domain/peroxiredoxin